MKIIEIIFGALMVLCEIVIPVVMGIGFILLILVGIIGCIIN